MFSRGVVASSCIVLLAGCATLPDVTVSYYFPKAETQIAVTQTLSCSSTKDAVVEVVTVTIPATTYSSDLESRKGTLRYADLNGPLSDTDVTVNWTDDGRLAGINATTTGEAGKIVASTLALVAAAAPMFALEHNVPVLPEHRKKIVSACAVIDQYGKDNALSLTYGRMVTYAESDWGKGVEIVVDPGYTRVYKELNALYPDTFRFIVRATKVVPVVESARYGAAHSGANGVVEIELNRTTVARLEVTGPDGSLQAQKLFSTTQVVVPLKVLPVPDYVLPIPRPPIFGEQTFALELSGAGSVTKLGYKKTSGAADVVDIATALAKAAAPQTPGQQAQALKDQADLIVQQQRLAKCQADPANCPP